MVDGERELTREEELEGHLSDAVDLIRQAARELHRSQPVEVDEALGNRFRLFLARPLVRHVHETVHLREGATIEMMDAVMWLKHAEVQIGFSKDLQTRVLARRVMALVWELEESRQREAILDEQLHPQFGR